MIPRLETERLILREWRQSDLDSMAMILGDPEVMRYLTGEPLARSDAWRNMASAAGHWVLRGYGTWAVERKSDGALIGRVGLIQPEGWPGLEVGWTLGRAFWGHGYATEAAQASMRHGFLTQPVDKLLSLIHPENRQSQAVARRLGETQGPFHEVTIGGKNYPVHIWSISRADWGVRALAQ
jgi:RimJ/RimL family protein N-acetyltransferase